jgi:hypothetical protein
MKTVFSSGLLLNLNCVGVHNGFANSVDFGSEFFFPE